MAIDPRFVLTSDLEEYLVDKDSGQPLAGGIITFYSDINRSTKKPVYQLTGSPPNYSYAALPNPSELSGVGTFQDNLGNNIVPYYYPYTGTPADNTGIVELYYVDVRDANGVPQFTRQAWPNFSAQGNSGSGLSLKNYIPNGQFLFHNQINGTVFPPVTTNSFGSITLASQDIAQGGWSFSRVSGGTSVFANSFVRIPSAITGLFDYPRYAFNFECTSFNANDSIRDLQIYWPDVYTFSSGDPQGTQDYTFFFSATSNDSNTYTFTIWLTYFYGTGGTPSAPVQTQIGSVDVSPGYRSFNVNISGFGAPSGTLGTNDDDYIEIAIRGPSSSWTAQFTDFALVFGNVNLTAFPTQTEAMMKDEGIPGWLDTPTTDGSNFYLPIVMTPYGMTFDSTKIGTILADLKATAIQNTLPCDGSQYLTSGYSALGIPYSRLWAAAIWDSAVLAPKFGTGTNFVTCTENSGVANTLILATNSPGAQTNPSDGFVATGFTFNNTAPNSNTGTSTNYGYDVYCSSAGVVTFVSKTNTSPAALFGVGTAGFSGYASYNEGLSGTKYGFFFNAPNASSLANPGGAGKYFTFSSPSTNYYAWFFTVNEYDPNPGGTGIRINLQPTMPYTDVAFVISNVMSSHQTNTIVMTAASTIPESSYFVFYSATNKHVAWYNKGAGTQPVVVDAFDYIEIPINNTFTVAQVVQQTWYYINAKYFCVPNCEEMFLRGASNNEYWDPDYADRWYVSGLSSPGFAGSFEFPSYTAHFHAFTSQYQTTSPVYGGTKETGSDQFVYDLSHTTGNFSGNTSTSGLYDTRPVNMAVNWVIVY